MDKGTRVRVIGGQDAGVVGTIFWVGPDKFDPDSQRVGIKGDNGQTCWMSERLVEAIEGDEAAEAPIGETIAEPSRARTHDGPEPKRGTRVTWASGSGTVFWYGPSKFGDGMRCGVESDDGEKHWLDASQLSVDESASPAGGGGGRGGGDHGVGDNDLAEVGHDDAPPADGFGDDAPPDGWDDGDPGPGDDDAYYGEPEEAGLFIDED